jgi:hypothetical protein
LGGACREATHEGKTLVGDASCRVAPRALGKVTEQVYLGRGMRLPLPDVVLSNSVILGKGGSGKSHLARVLAEELMAHNRRARSDVAKTSVAIFAPSGNWWGIRAGADGGRRGGHRVLTIGGQHGDFAVDSTKGARIATLVDAVAPTPVLVEMDALAVHEQQELMADFAEQLRVRRARHPLHILLDGAEDFCPFVARRGAQLRGNIALNYLAGRGRSRGVAVTVTAYRLALLDRNVSSQADHFFVFRLAVPHDLAAASELLGYGAPEVKRQFRCGVAALGRGEAFYVTYGEHYRHVRFRVRRPRTYVAGDFSSTGMAGETGPTLSSVGKRVRKVAQAILFPEASKVKGRRRQQDVGLRDEPGQRRGDCDGETDQR